MALSTLGASQRVEPVVNAPTARFRQAVCRGPLIRLPDAAIGVPRLAPLLKQRAALVAAPVVCVGLHGGRSRGLAVTLQTLQYVAGGLTWPACTATDNTIDDQPTPTRDRHHRQRYRPTPVPADARVADPRCRLVCRFAARVFAVVVRPAVSFGGGDADGNSAARHSRTPAHPTSTRPRGSGAAQRTAVLARAQRNWVDRRRAVILPEWRKQGWLDQHPVAPIAIQGRRWRQVAVTNALRRALGSCTAAAPPWTT